MTDKSIVRSLVDNYNNYVSFKSAFTNRDVINFTYIGDTEDFIKEIEEFTGKKGQKAPTVAQQREMILKARTETPRKIELVNLKNRFNQPGYTCYYDYYAAYDAFCEDGYSKP